MSLVPVPGATPDQRLDHLSDTVTALAVAHMVGGLRVANRLRQDRGLAMYTAGEILQLLGVKDHATIALQVLCEMVEEYQPELVGARAVEAIEQARVAVGKGVTP